MDDVKIKEKDHLYMDEMILKALKTEREGQVMTTAKRMIWVTFRK